MKPPSRDELLRAAGELVAMSAVRSLRGAVVVVDADGLKDAFPYRPADRPGALNTVWVPIPDHASLSVDQALAALELALEARQSELGEIAEVVRRDGLRERAREVEALMYD